jgi:isoleucyl-tRNA synthetase
MYNAKLEEEKVLDFWLKNKTFEETLKNRDGAEKFVFFDGPPFATGLPHYGHLVASTMKDVIPRFKTMQGYYVPRRWGWDCHGLPIENIIEKELNLNTRQDILEYGVKNFNDACRGAVLKYREEWKKVITRLGRFVDMENDYKTMDRDYMESVWNVFHEIHKKGFVYEGKRIMQICPRCETALSNFEVTDGYKDIKDISIVAKFKVKREGENYEKNFKTENDLFILAWTTTPWTLPGNTMLAVNEKIEYSLVRFDGNNYLIGKETLMNWFSELEFEVLGQFRGNELVGLNYVPLFDYYQDESEAKNSYKVVGAEFVDTTSGTGVVHIAPAFGQDDYEVYQKNGGMFIQHVKMNGFFDEKVVDFREMQAKPKEDHTKTDVEVIKFLAGKNLLFKKLKIDHSYPHCWRCDTPLLNYATTAWFIAVSKIKENLLKSNQEINWTPDHIKNGRFGNWLEGARDWCVSRSRFWGTPLPIWKSDDGEIKCLSSAKDLEELTGKKIEDLHKHFVDGLTFEFNGKIFKKIPEVFDCWFESGSMPYGENHYPFENKENVENNFPGDFISEGQDQTRGWFYTLHVIANILTLGEKSNFPKIKNSGAFKNVIVNGIVLASDGKKMSKKLKNYPDPMEVIEKYGSDAVRFYLMNSPVVEAENLNFDENGVREIYSKLTGTLSNILELFLSYKNEVEFDRSLESTNALDLWIKARFHETLRKVTNYLENYRLNYAAREILEFVREFSEWYVRRAKERLKADNDEDKKEVLATLNYVLEETSKMIAPYCPFVADYLWFNLGHNSSVHTENWTNFDENKIDKLVLQKMEKTREVVELVLSLRKEMKIKVRQILGNVFVSLKKDDFYEEILLSELNVKKFSNTKLDDMDFKQNLGFEVGLSRTLTKELIEEGNLRSLIRGINQFRKNNGLKKTDIVSVKVKGGKDLTEILEKYKENLLKQTQISDFEVENLEGETDFENLEITKTI